MARKILLADDSVTAQNMGRKILADAGYEVITVNNGSAALKKIAELRPDLIVLDVYMPGYSGLEVCQRLKEVSDTSRIPVLLTVGKLEPFKPEEAKRVRADGYIVKPFEASELLGALSKLEDKIVPVAEPKPGRLARASAAIDEGRRDKTAAAEEDSGWKNRIGFPSKKKEKAEPEADEPAIYNPVNRDLRTVVDSKPSAQQQQEEARVDVGALAPEGLPKDVTAEEIAALAAAAAQVQGKIAEIKADAASEPVSAPVVEANAEAKSETQQEAVEAISQQDAAQDEPAKESAAVAESAPVETPAAVANQEFGNAQDADSGHESAPHASKYPADAPVTMAVAAGTESHPHWTAVAVALAPEETGISLEEEMRKTYASFAGASESAAAVSSSPEVEPRAAAEVPAEVAVEVPAQIEAQPEAHAVSAEIHAEAPVESPAPASAPMSEVASMASEAFSSVVKKFETVASSFMSRREPEPDVAAAVAYDPAVVEAQAEVSQPNPEETKTPEQKFESAEPAAAEVGSVAEPAAHMTVAEAAVDAVERIAGPGPAVASSYAASPAEQENSAPVSSTSDSGTNGHHEAENIAATTAAAWANWRRGRETDPSSPAQPPDAAAMAAAAGAEKSPEEVAAKLISEKLGFDHASDPAIASIVDSMLADLRPKIVEEISRKLGKK